METPLSILLKRKGEQVYGVSPDDTVAKAVEKMNAEKVGAVAVIEKDRLIGIFTERDVLRKVIGAHLNADKTAIKDVMSSHVLTVSPSTTVGEAMKIITDHRFRHLPVVEEDRLIGLISSGDLTYWLSKNQEIKIRDLEKYICGDR